MNVSKVPAVYSPSVRYDPQVYERHYVWRKEQGWPGWFTAEGLGPILDELDRRVRSLDLGPRMLEVGCGAGNQALAVARRGFDASGIDMSATAVAWAQATARERGLPADFRVGDVRNLPWGESEFDWVLDGNCWHFVVGAESRSQFLGEVFRVLKPGGLFLVTSVCNDPLEPMEGYDPESRSMIADGMAVTYMAPEDELTSDLASAGFEIERFWIEPGKPGISSDFYRADARKPR